MCIQKKRNKKRERKQHTFKQKKIKPVSCDLAGMSCLRSHASHAGDGRVLYHRHIVCFVSMPKACAFGVEKPRTCGDGKELVRRDATNRVASLDARCVFGWTYGWMRMQTWRARHPVVAFAEGRGRRGMPAAVVDLTSDFRVSDLTK